MGAAFTSKPHADSMRPIRFLKGTWARTAVVPSISWATRRRRSPTARSPRIARPRPRDRCSRQANGGGILIVPFSSASGFLTVGISNSTFVGNSVSGSGAGVYVESSTGTRPALTVEGGAFQANTADVNGGAFHITSTTTQPALCRFFSERRWANGAGLYASATTLSMSHTSMKLNTATESGGALYMDDGASVLLCNQSSSFATLLGRAVPLALLQAEAVSGIALRAERGYGRPGQGRCRNAPRRGEVDPSQFVGPDAESLRGEQRGQHGRGHRLGRGTVFEQLVVRRARPCDRPAERRGQRHATGFVGEHRERHVRRLLW